ncbi:hypothetical protein [Novosphingobium sp. 9U]|uniref:hypothetical protein n=1 Tax=Novosphingobium sp. 9U TaxID=2653158 RepID=UPI001915F412|nr:hypothetical protein [Novosphingobium sp. 9U]
MRSNHLSYRPILRTKLATNLSIGVPAGGSEPAQACNAKQPGMMPGQLRAAFPEMKGHEDDGMFYTKGAKLFQTQGLALSFRSLERR